MCDLEVGLQSLEKAATSGDDAATAIGACSVAADISHAAHGIPGARANRVIRECGELVDEQQKDWVSQTKTHAQYLNDSANNYRRNEDAAREAFR